MSERVAHAIISHRPGFLDKVELFERYSAAADHFENLLAAEMKAHPDDEAWVTAFTFQYSDESMCFLTRDDQQVYYAKLPIR